MRQLYYIYLRLFKGYMRVNDLGYKLIRFNMAFDGIEPDLVVIGPNDFLVSVPKRNERGYYA